MAHWKRNYTRYRAHLLNLSERYRKSKNLMAYLEIMLSLIVIIVFSIFALRPTLLTIGTLVKEISVKEDTLVKLDIKVTNLQKAIEVFEQEEGRIKLVNESLPTTADPVAFLRQVETLSTQYPTNLSSLGTGPVVLSDEDTVSPNHAGKNILLFETSLSGEYLHLSQFLSDLDHFRRPVQLVSITFKANQTEEGKRLDLVLEGETYFQSIHPERGEETQE